MKKIMKIALALLLIGGALALSLTMVYITVTSGARLDETKLVNYSQSVTFCDAEGNKIATSSIEGNRSSVTADKLHDYTKNAFIASEDRRFYSHGGLDPARMVKALFKNIAGLSFKEGASTISQQLVKNTHLSNKKTIKRKLVEIKLARQLEKRYQKDEILEMYLNTIYFGHGCYGLQSAARFYFSKDAADLSLTESATLAGLLSSPNNYSPFKDQEKCLKRRNLVLKSMLDCGFITEEEYKEASAHPIGAVKNDEAFFANRYLDGAASELEAVGLDCYTELAGCKVYTSLDQNAQRAAESVAFDADGAIIITNEQNGICALAGTLTNVARQPGSTIKPLLVYAPAIEEKLIHTFTKIDDSPVNYGGYSPKNHDGKYHGNVTAAESLIKSYNIPAVKIMNSLTTVRAKEYAEKLAISLDKEDENLALALGGMKYGVTIKTLCDGYTTFRRGGIYGPSKFIKRIENSKGKVIYTAEGNYRRAFSDGTCSLINQTLIQTSVEGTAKKLKNFGYEIASKTGTCGDSEGNTDAYAIAYTSQHTIAVWMGDRENNKSDITGGGSCCNALLKILPEIYKKAPPPLEKDEGTKVVQIDRDDYINFGKIVLADDISPSINKFQVKCLNVNVPSAKSSKFSHPTIQKPQITLKNNEISIVLCQTKYYSYLIEFDDNVVYDGPYSKDLKFSLPSRRCKMTITPYYIFEGKKYMGESLAFSVDLADRPFELPPDITKKNWYSDL